MAPSSGGDYITSERFYEQQIQTNELLSRVNEQLAVLNALMVDTREEQAEVRTRLVAVERWKYGIPIAYIGILLSFLTKSTGKS